MTNRRVIAFIRAVECVRFRKDSLMETAVMSYETRVTATPARRSKPASTAATFVCGLWTVVLAILALPAFAATPPTGNAAQVNPRLASLRIDIWPEYDRQAALIILKAELSPDTPLPAVVSLRLPAASGGPSAVAFASAAGSELFNLQHEVTSTGNYSTLRFTAPQRFIHVEYYDALATGSSMRAYTYVWPGDLAVDRLSVRLQEPAATTDVSVLPDLGPGTAGPEGLFYRTLNLGAYEAGKQLPIAIRYTKPDSRTSVEILKLNTPAVKSPEPAGSIENYPGWTVFVTIVVALTVGLGLAALWWVWRRRKAASGFRPAIAGFCSQCGSALAPGNHYCSSCGAPVQQR